MTTKVEFNLKSNENNVSLITNQEKKQQSDNVNKSDTSPCRINMLSRRKKRGRIPHLFERSSKKWWNPQMDSKILEKQCLDFSLEQSIWYFHFALVFIMVACVAWIIYFGSRQQPDEWIAGVAWAAVLTVICIILFVVTKKTKFYKKFSCYIAIGVASLLIATVLLAAYFSSVIMTSVGSFFLASEVILLLYTVMPLPLHINFALGLAFSFAYEIIYRIGLWEASAGDIIAHILLHLCIHVIGVQICLNLQVRRRSTFWKVGQIIKSNQSIEVEQNFNKVMIDSIMPPSVSVKLMNKEGRELFATTAKEEGRFRKLYVERMENVSILYADIVGFTKMSANKTAATLVYLLNDLFGRFDALCLSTGCEKISTLGDCYYCVAGCPDPKPDHAKCCVEMGLGMIDAIKRFCTDNDVNVNMRIGIHTGIVICGIVGMKRFKFDVWSNDVSLANQMEQYGVPGRIHVSQSTRDCLGELYEVEDGRIEERAPEDFVAKTVKTYLIVDRTDSDTSSMSGESSTSSTSQNGDVADQVDQKTQEMVSIENEIKTQPNGVRVEDTVIIKTPQDNGDAQQSGDDNQQDGSKPITNNKVGIAGDNAGEDHNPLNGTYDHESTLQTDPLLSVKRVSTRHHHHHSSRYKSRRRHEANADDPNSKQNQILGWYVLPLLNAASQSSVRVKQDSEFVDTIKNDPRMKNINNNEPLEKVSMMFKDKKIETEYRNKFHNEVENDEEITSFVSARFSFMLDLLISFIVFALVSFASLAEFGFRAAWCIVLILVFIVMGFVVYMVYNYVFNIENVPKWVKAFSGWVPRHFLGVICLACPAAMVFSNMYCHSDGSLIPDCATYLIIMGIVLIHFLNFNQLSSWIRSIIASIVAITILLLVYLNPCSERVVVTTGINNTTDIVTTNWLCLSASSKYQYEFILDILLLMLFIFIVNREYEVGHRLTFFIAHEAEESNKKMGEERNQMDTLLLHIIPPHVQEVIREKNMYSQNHENVGVIFASIINFTEFYEESYAGGTECIRVLNELIGDVDQLLDNEKYAEVEKIKTIGSTFMIASGLNPNIEREPSNNSHLCTLMHFCTEVQDVIFEFNENMVCFTFILRIGFNHGSVTAGVIGTTKLLYDIWGDTVNIASRMDSTGVPGKIQVSENSQNCLKDQFDFTYRGSTMVKGKGEMQTYLLHRESERPIKENPKETPKNFEGQES